MIAVEPWQLSAEGLAAAIRGGDLSATEALESVLARADAITGALNPFAVRLDDRAREAAAGADAAIRRGDAGPLAGVPVTIKDSQWLAGITLLLEQSQGAATQVFQRGLVAVRGERDQRPVGEPAGIGHGRPPP